MQTGYGNAGDIWSTATTHPPAVAPGLATTNRVCVYDRPGTTRSLDDAGNPLASAEPGRSDQVPMPRTATAVVTEWHDLLATAEVPGPYLLVGHSVGGLFTVLYARTYPDQVAGMVLIDTTPPALASLLPPKARSLLEASMQAPSPIPGYPYEAYDLDDILSSIDAAPAMRPAPATLLFAGQFQQVSDPTAQEFVKDVAVVQDQARAQFAASIPGATTSLVPDATHYIHVDAAGRGHRGGSGRGAQGLMDPTPAHAGKRARCAPVYGAQQRVRQVVRGIRAMIALPTAMQ